MGIVNLPRISDYWSTDHFFKTYVWSNTMSKNRYLLLLRFWHFEIEGDNERLHKVAYLINNLNEKMKEIYCPDQSLPLDESMVLWRGRLIFSQYNKNKKHKHGVRFYELCDSRGLILRSMIYSGIPYPDPYSLGQTGAILLKLMKYFIGKVYTVHADDFSNSVNLTKHMSSSGTYICGRLRADRKNNPKEVVQKKLGKGEMV